MTAPAPRNHPAEDAHPAPTPAPVAVPEGGWREGDVVAVLNSNGYPFVHERRRDGSWTGLRGLMNDSWISQAIEVGGWVIWVYAPRQDAPRPEPVVAPLPSEAIAVNANPADVDVTEVADRGHEITPPSEHSVDAMAETLRIAFLPAADDVVKPRPLDQRLHEAAHYVLSQGYRLVPEGDEDTVRVPSIGDTCCGDCVGPCYVDQVTGA